MKKKIVKIWDFDGVLFWNDEKNYSDAFLRQAKKNRVAIIPQTDINVLFTGRPLAQQFLVYQVLSLRNLHFDYAVFSPFTEKEFALNNYLDIYYDWKLKVMKDTFYVLYPENMGYQLCLLDDDNKVINTMQQNQIKAKLIPVNQWVKKWTNAMIMA